MPENIDKNIYNCFDPIVDEKTKILILGTLPGPEALRTGQYYKKSSNCFWRIIYSLYEQEPTMDYDEKCSFLLKQNIGIWDVLKCAERDGYADTDIRNAEPNDFNMFFKKYPQITGVIFNGKEAEKQFRDEFPLLYNSIDHERVFSSSGALTKSFIVKLENWKSGITRLTN